MSFAGLAYLSKRIMTPRILIRLAHLLNEQHDTVYPVECCMLLQCKNECYATDEFGIKLTKAQCLKKQ